MLTRSSGATNYHRPCAQADVKIDEKGGWALMPIRKSSERWHSTAWMENLRPLWRPDAI
jgi:hypothetical protein